MNTTQTITTKGITMKNATTKTTKNAPETHEADYNNHKVQVTVPENPNEEEMLTAAIQDALGPDAVAAIAVALQTVRTGNEETDSQVAWLAELMTGMLRYAPLTK